jgi:hypothetical protein
MLSLARHAMSFFPYATPRQRASHAVKWAAAIEYLGPRWILNQKVLRRAEG